MDQKSKAEYNILENSTENIDQNQIHLHHSKDLEIEAQLLKEKNELF